ncbi:MAG: hypothetical protein H6737_20485 [Alphaproteobacteria bacterium]|nr:hypothetical protein [Alphaproteobacteria bacterium]
MLRSVLFALAAVGCAPFEPGAGPMLDDASHRALVDGSPEAHGVLALLNDAGTTVDLLDDDAGLDVRAARGLVARRDGADGRQGTADDRPYTSIAEVDAVKYVGPAALDRLSAYAQAAGWVLHDDDLLGVYDGVAFTVAEADATLRLANEAEHAWLDDTLGLDSRAADGIVAARPIADLAALAAVPYVGESALRRLRQAAMVVPSEVPLADRFVVDLEPTLAYWYGQYGADVEAMGGNTLEQAIDALDPSLVYELTDPEDDPYGHDFDRFVVVVHPDVAFPGSDRVWFGIYDRVSGSLSGTNWY